MQWVLGPMSQSSDTQKQRLVTVSGLEQFRHIFNYNAMQPQPSLQPTTISCCQWWHLAIAYKLHCWTSCLALTKLLIKYCWISGKLLIFSVFYANEPFVVKLVPHCGIEIQTLQDIPYWYRHHFGDVNNIEANWMTSIQQLRVHSSH